MPHLLAKGPRSFAAAGIKQSREHFEIEKFSAVASAIARVKRKVEADKRVAEKIEEIVKTINKSQKKI